MIHKILIHSMRMRTGFLFSLIVWTLFIVWNTQWRHGKVKIITIIRLRSNVNPVTRKLFRLILVPHLRINFSSIQSNATTSAGFKTCIECTVVDASNCFNFKIIQLYHLYMRKYHHIRILLRIIFDIIKLFNIHPFRSIDWYQGRAAYNIWNMLQYHPCKCNGQGSPKFLIS